MVILRYIEYGFLLKDGHFVGNSWFHSAQGLGTRKALVQALHEVPVVSQLLVGVNAGGQLQVWCTNRDVSTAGGMKHSKSMELFNLFLGIQSDESELQTF